MEQKHRFKLETFLNNEKEAYHVARTTISAKNDLQMHQHGYAEIFWIKAGKGLHLINGKEINLEIGSLCMVRPNDYHTFRLANNQNNMIVTNVAFDEKSLAYYKTRYFPGSDSYFWSTAEMPFMFQLEPDQLSELSAMTDRLLGQPRDFLHLDYIMINIFRMINAIGSDQLHIPHWLAYALENFNSPQYLQQGIKGFVDLTGRSSDHVNRVLQQYLKQTLTETILKARIQYSSEQLIMTNSPVKTICFNSGFDSMSYFYRTFKNATGQTPVEFRKRNHKIF